MTTAAPSLIVPRRFRGPSSSGNGGWSAGALAAYLPDAPAVAVRLRRPPPLDTPLTVTTGPAGDGDPRRVAVARRGEDVVLEAAEVADDLDRLPGVPFELALQVGDGYAGLTAHPFPECFACGTARTPGEALALRPGPLPNGSGRTAAAWVPDARLAEADGTIPRTIVWAALDCPGGWTVDIGGRPMVLGTMTASVTRCPAVGERCVVVGAHTGGEGRKVFTATTLHGEDGSVLARARAVWLVVDPASVRP